ncbi:molybdenum ABC transporter ATP-binding protein [Geminicoccaceae bacterium 1502E]|nr:molybdenum ABC transporter ATP-binding protein [Geminicoccaceae bacterium 1502E]
MSLEVALRHDFGPFGLDIAFSVDRPGITALFGPSGSGKSTTISAIAGLLRPAAGRIVVNGRVLLDTERGIVLPPRRRRLGYVFQDARLFPHLSVRSNLLFGWRRAGRPASRAEIDHLVELLGIGALLERRPGMLSGGERQRVALGRALLTAPEAVLLDEPLSALDHARKQEIMPYLERLRDEARMPMLYVSHAIDEVTRLADHMILLDGGRVAAAGAVSDVMARLDLFPLTGRFEAGAVLETVVGRHDAADALSELEFAGGRLVVPLVDAPPGARVRARVRARDVMLALHEPRDISANNILVAEVAGIRLDEGAFADVQLACGTTRLVARVTRRSVERLGLCPGLPIVAIIKAVTVDRRSLSPMGEPPAA